jgi:hypothetical protein
LNYYNNIDSIEIGVTLANYSNQPLEIRFFRASSGVLKDLNLDSAMVKTKISPHHYFTQYEEIVDKQQSTTIGNVGMKFTPVNFMRVKMGADTLTIHYEVIL